MVFLSTRVVYICVSSRIVCYLLCYFHTNTDPSDNTVSREYDEVYQAMSKVGMAMTASSSVRDLTQKSSSSSAGGGHRQDTLDMVGASGTLGVPATGSAMLRASDTHTPSFAMQTLPQPHLSTGLLLIVPVL